MCLVGRNYGGGLRGVAVSWDWIVGSAGPADLVGEACLLIVGVQELVESLVVGGAGGVVSLGVEARPHSDRRLQGGGSQLH